MKKPKYNKFNIIDTDIDLSDEYNTYKEECEMNGIEAQEETSSDFYEWQADTANRYVCDEWANLRCYKYNKPVIITGTLGLWNGDHDIAPVIVTSSNTKNNTIYSAISKCVGSSSDDYDAKYEDGVIYVNAYHHDGRNRFEVWGLSAKGLKHFANELENDEHYIQLPIGTEIKREWLKLLNSDEFGM